MGDSASRTGPDQHGKEWGSFIAAYGEWARARLNEDDLLYCLPPGNLPHALSLFQLDDATLEAEAALASLCDVHHAIGWGANGPVRYRLLGEPLPLPQIDGLERLLKLGWSQENIDWVKKGGVPGEDVFNRMRAAAGRLLTSKDFLEDRNRLRTVWLALEDRPSLPLTAPPGVSQLPGEIDWKKVNPEAAEFWNRFASFCTQWQLLGMATWELPEPDGPKWSATLTPPDLADKGVIQLQTPWHFPLQQADGLGEIVLEEHDRSAAEHGVDDHGSWETYVKMLPLAHWHDRLTERYPKTQLDRS